MKSFLIFSIFLFTSAYFIAAQKLTEEGIFKKEAEAEKECNASFPVTESLRQKIGIAVLKGEAFEKNAYQNNQLCHLNCFLQKVGFFDSESNMRAPQIFKYALVTAPEIAVNSHNLIAQLYEIIRSTKGIQDKCWKAYVCYRKFIEGVFVNTVAIDLNAQTDVREKIIQALLSGEELSKELQDKVLDHFKKFDQEIAKTFSS